MAATGAGARFILEVFALSIIRTMELTTILNHCYPHQDCRLPGPGTVLTRRLGDRQIVVKVLAEGFEYESRRYRSLSAIAREVTGTRWNGLLFFWLLT
jgi:hypothetical protein